MDLTLRFNPQEMGDEQFWTVKMMGTDGFQRKY